MFQQSRLQKGVSFSFFQTVSPFSIIAPSFFHCAISHESPPPIVTIWYNISSEKILPRQLPRSCFSCSPGDSRSPHFRVFTSADRCCLSCETLMASGLGLNRNKPAKQRLLRATLSAPKKHVCGDLNIPSVLYS